MKEQIPLPKIDCPKLRKCKLGHDAFTCSRRNNCARSGFSLIELLAVTVVILLLVAIALPAFRSVRERANISKCQGNLRQLGVAFQMYVAENENWMPLHWWYDRELSPPNTWWHKELSAYMNVTWNPAGLGSLDEVFRCPEDELFCQGYIIGEPSYGYNRNLGQGGDAGRGAVQNRKKMLMVENPADTVLMADSGHASEDGAIAYNMSFNNDGQNIYPRHGGGANVLWVDGHVTFEDSKGIEVINNDETKWLP